VRGELRSQVTWVTFLLADEDPMSSDNGTSSLRALVVDDDDPIRRMLAAVVERQNFTVDTARDGKEAIARIAGDGYALILLDLMMPHVDGYAVLRYMQEHRSEDLACTIIASAVAERDVLSQFSLPVFSIHTKPFDMEQLIADVRLCAARNG
jgi:DNA-binding response OmpR family regulator